MNSVKVEAGKGGSLSSCSYRDVVIRGLKSAKSSPSPKVDDSKPILSKLNSNKICKAPILQKTNKNKPALLSLESSSQNKKQHQVRRHISWNICVDSLQMNVCSKVCILYLDYPYTQSTFISLYKQLGRREHRKRCRKYQDSRYYCCKSICKRKDPYHW